MPMKQLSLIAITIMTTIAVVGGFLMAGSTSYGGGSIIIQSSKSQQFEAGLTLVMFGVLVIAFVGWFNAVNGKTSIFRRRPRPGWPTSLN
jgi:hypothetical protein